MEVAVFGLGPMGSQIARRLHRGGVSVRGWNRSEGPREAVAAAGVPVYGDVSGLVSAMPETRRVFWTMLPSDVVGDFLAPSGQLGSLLRPGDTVIDGGNTFYKESVARGAELSARGVHFFDSGTSGGVWGEENGFALMVGGPNEQWPTVEPIFKVLSSGQNYGLVGSSGAGHFVKMVHNGIEYGMMEAIGEGYAVMQAAPFGVDLLQVTKIYQEGSVVRSWLIDLMRNIFEHEDIAGTKGEIGAKGEGEWTVQAGKELGVDVRVIEASLEVRRESKLPENQGKFSNKIVALLRKQFGGHAVVSR